MSDNEEQESFDAGEEGLEDEAAADEDPLGDEEIGDEAGEEEDDLELKSGEEEQGEEEEEEEKDPEVPLTEEVIAECLSLLCKTGDGLAHAYVRLDVKERELTDISILNSYIHLRYVDLTQNKLKDISPLGSLTHLLTLKANNNKLTSAKLDELPYLQVASFEENKIRTTEGVSHPLLEHLSLNNNLIPMIKGLEAEKLCRLHTLELRENKLESTAGINLPQLKNLFLARNKITRLEGLEGLESLATLHLRDNQLESLDGFSEGLKTLQYINLRGNKLLDIKEVKKLQVLPLLRAVVISENPLAEEDEYRLEVLIALRRIERLDKDEYNEDERQEAQDIYEQRRQEELQLEAQEQVVGSDTEEQAA